MCLSQHAHLVPPGSAVMCARCLLLLPVGEEQGSDTACPFNSLATFDMRRAEVSLTYFPLAALLLSGGAPQRGVGVGRGWGGWGECMEGGVAYASTAVLVC